MTGTLIRTISPARRQAFSALQAVAKGAYASDTLMETGRDLSSRDAGLASQIVFGCLRFQAQLDYLIELYSGKRARDLDLPVLIALRAAIFQLRYLSRVPPHAAVHESVNFVYSQKRAAAGFTNAVLRKVDREPVEWPNVAVELSCPEWLLERWAEHFGKTQAESIARSALQEPVSYVRIAPNGSLPSPDLFEATEIAGAYRVISPVSGIRLHDIGSQSLLPLLDLQSGQSFLDVCAAPGNKTVQALETSLRLAIACDVSFARLATVPAVLPRVVLDATAPLPFDYLFDRIFVDAPCSGTGTIGRNPEIKWRVQTGDFKRFQEKQMLILERSLEVLTAGGKLLYATCSLERDENEEVLGAVLAKRPEFECSRVVWRLPGRDQGDGFYAALLQRKAQYHDKIQKVPQL